MKHIGRPLTYTVWNALKQIEDILESYTLVRSWDRTCTPEIARFLWRCFGTLFTLFLLPAKGDGQDVSVTLDTFLKKYEILDLDTRSVFVKARQGQSNEVAISLQIKDWDIRLFPSNILADDFFITVAGEKGDSIVRDEFPVPMQGFTQNGGLVSLTFNDHFVYGFIQDGDKTYHIQPVRHFTKGSRDNSFVLYEAGDQRVKAEAHCGNPHIVAQPDTLHQHEQDRMMMDCNCRSILIAIAADYTMTQQYGSYWDVSNFVIGALNDVQTNYDNEFSRFLKYNLQTLFIVNTASQDPWYKGDNGDALLSSFNNWGNANGFNIANYGYSVASLWTDRNIQRGGNYGVAGLATVGGACTQSRYNLLEDLNYATVNRVIMAHEIGHNFGADHDAGGSPHIMAPTASSASTWSGNSKTVIQQHINNHLSCVPACQNSSSFPDQLPSQIECSVPVYLHTDAGVGIWNSSSCGTSNCGQEAIGVFRAPVTGYYTLSVNSTNGTPVNYSFKRVSLGQNANSFTCIGTFSTYGQINFGPLTAGIEYYILADPQNPEIVSHTFQILCPPECTSLVIPANGSENVPVSTDFFWTPVAFATGYKIKVNSFSPGAEFSQTYDVGRVSTFNLPVNLPANAEIQVMILPKRNQTLADPCATTWFRTTCSATVNNTNDNGFGSLRGAISCPNSGDTIFIHASILNRVIGLYSGPIRIDRTIVIQGTPSQKVKIRSVNNGPVFHILPDGHLSLEHAEIFGGMMDTGRAIINEGVLYLKQTTIYDEPALANQGPAVQNSPDAEIFIPSLSSIRLATFNCGQPLTIQHAVGEVAPKTVSISYGTRLDTINGDPFCWITRNLGAETQPSSALDASLTSAGWYFQFNRRQGYRTITSDVTSPLFPGTWRSTFEDNESDWSVCNDPCALSLGSGWRIPSTSEWSDINTWSSVQQAFSSPYKLHAAGYLNSDGGITQRGTASTYWHNTSEVSLTGHATFITTQQSVNTYTSLKSNGHTVRCIKPLNDFSTSPSAYISTLRVDSIANNKARLVGELVCEGLSDAVNKGFCYSTTPMPDLADPNVFVGPGTGFFQTTITGLSNQTTYYVRAFVIEPQDTLYANELSFTTYLPGACGSPFTKNHVQGTVAPVNKTVTYQTVQTDITGSNKCWIAQNLGANTTGSEYYDGSEEAAGWYWQFNRKQGYKHDGVLRTPNTTWEDDIYESADWTASQDPCKLLLDAQWRIPTRTEWETAAGYPENWEVIYDGFYSPLQLHAGGLLSWNDGSLIDRGIFGTGAFSSSTQLGPGDQNAILLGPYFFYHSNSKSNGNSIRCLRNIVFPGVSTTGVNSITHVNAQASGTITSAGENLILQRGVCYGVTPNPTIDDRVSVHASTGLGSFSVRLSGLTPSTFYYIRAFATTQDGTSYGNQMTLTSGSSPLFACGDTMTLTHYISDINPETKTVDYPTILSALSGEEKCWITQNLGASHAASSALDASEPSAGWYWQFNRKRGFKHDGVVRTPDDGWMPQISESQDWSMDQDPCVQEFGAGWRIPSVGEWSAVLDHWTTLSDAYTSPLRIHAAGYLPNLNGELLDRGTSAWFWTSTEVEATNGAALSLTPNSLSVFHEGIEKARGASIRCLRDQKPSVTLDTLREESSVSVLCDANVTHDGGTAVLEKGVCYSVQPEPTLDDEVVLYGSATGSYSVMISSLWPDTTYYIRAFATNAVGTSYSEARVFNTDTLSLLLVPFDSSTNLSVCGAAIYDHGGPDNEYEEYADGFLTLYPSFGQRLSIDGILDTEEDYDYLVIYNGDGISEDILYENSGQTTFNNVLSEVNGAVTIRFTSDGSIEESGFSLTVECVNEPIVTTAEVIPLGHQLYRTGGNIAFDAGTYFTQKGICFHTDTLPDVFDQKVEAGEGMGPFLIDVSGLLIGVPYYFRAYGITASDTFYGNQVLLQTPEHICGDSMVVRHLQSAFTPSSKTTTYHTIQTNISGNPGCWITQNLGAAQPAETATDTSEASAGWYWQFNRKQGFSYLGSQRTPNTPWILVIEENSNWMQDRDPCRHLLGTTWRIPTGTEWMSADGPPQNWNSIADAFTSPIQLHNAGLLAPFLDGELISRGSSGLYWGSTQSSNGNAAALSISNSSSAMFNYNKAFGGSLRCIKSLHAPDLAMPEIIEVDSSTVFLHSDMPTHGGITLEDRGVCYALHPNPTLADSVLSYGPQTGRLFIQIDSLLPDTTYYVRAYASNALGVTLSDSVSFRTYHPCGMPLIRTHVAGNVAPVTKTVAYPTDTVTLNGSTRCWILQNLGASVQPDSVDDEDEAATGWYWQFNQKQGFKHDGITRTPGTAWPVANMQNADWMPNQDPCRLLLGSGWRIPTRTEYQQLMDHFDIDDGNDGFDSPLVFHSGGYLIDTGDLVNRGTSGHYFTQSKLGPTQAWSMEIWSLFSYAGFVEDDKINGLSLRCIRD